MKLAVTTLSLLLTACSAIAEQKRVVCFGDSVTLGRGMPAGASWCDQLGAVKNIKTINLGVGGDSTREGLARFSEIFKYKPHAVVVMFGLNDADDRENTGARVSLEEYESNLDWMIKKLKARKIKVILQTSNCTTSSDANFKLKPYILTVRRLAQNHNIELIENYSPFCEAAMEGQPYYIDYLHPSEIGHHDIAQRVIKVIKKWR